MFTEVNKEKKNLSIDQSYISIFYLIAGMGAERCLSYLQNLLSVHYVLFSY